MIDVQMGQDDHPDIFDANAVTGKLRLEAVLFAKFRLQAERQSCQRLDAARAGIDQNRVFASLDQKSIGGREHAAALLAAG